MVWHDLSLIILFQALQRTLEFEEELAEKFGGGSRNTEREVDSEENDKAESSNRIVSDIRKKYEKKLAVNQEENSEVCIKAFAFLCYPSINNILVT